MFLAILTLRVCKQIRVLNYMLGASYAHKIIYCTLRGRIKDKNSTLYAIKCQVRCIENTARWLTNTVQLC